MTNKTINPEKIAEICSNYAINFEFLFNKELEKVITNHNNTGIDVFNLDKNEDELEYCVLITSNNISLMDFIFDGNEIKVNVKPEVEDNIIHLVVEANLESKRFNIKKDVSFRVTPNELDNLEKTNQRIIEPCVESLIECIIYDAIINRYRNQIKRIIPLDGSLFTGEINLEEIWKKEYETRKGK